jgi:hypothetical protein
MAPNEIQYRTIDPRSLRLHHVEHEGWRILHGRSALMPVMRSSLLQRAQFALALGDVTRCNSLVARTPEPFYWL